MWNSNGHRSGEPTRNGPHRVGPILRALVLSIRMQDGLSWDGQFRSGQFLADLSLVFPSVRNPEPAQCASATACWAPALPSALARVGLIPALASLGACKRDDHLIQASSTLVCPHRVCHFLALPRNYVLQEACCRRCGRLPVCRRSSCLQRDGLHLWIRPRIAQGDVQVCHLSSTLPAVRRCLWVDLGQTS